MKPRPFFCQVTSYGKVSRTLWEKRVGDIHQYFCLGIGNHPYSHIESFHGIGTMEMHIKYRQEPIELIGCYRISKHTIHGFG